jgi:DNA-binding SARP family transcriptional activator
LPEVFPSSERTRIQLCGRLSVEIDGVQVADALRGKQVPLLFAYFVLSALGREELIGALWPHQAPRSQDAALRTLLSRLRSALGRSALVGRDELALELAEPAWIDVEAAFSQLDRARAMLERGDARVAWALAQVPINIVSRGLLPGAHADWLDHTRRELEDLRLQALDVIGRAGLELGGNQLGSAERAARALIEAEPYRESGYVLLMRALAARGNSAEGLLVFDHLRTPLRDQLGSAPSHETIAAHEALIRPAPRPPEARARGGSATLGARRAYWDREHLQQRLTDATEMLRHARAAGDVELALQGHAWLVVDLLEKGDPAPSKFRSGHSARARSACVSRSIYGTPRSGARCRSCSRAGWSPPSGWPPKP